MFVGCAWLLQIACGRCLAVVGGNAYAVLLLGSRLGLTRAPQASGEEYGLSSIKATTWSQVATVGAASIWEFTKMRAHNIHPQIVGLPYADPDKVPQIPETSI